MTELTTNRRTFIQTAAAVGGGILLAGCATGPGGELSAAKQKPVDDVLPAEDLMREHGVLKRVLLCYEEAVMRIDAKMDLPPEPVANAAGIIRAFIEDYHEKLEENYIFPRFIKANVHTELVSVLQVQHTAGRRLTDTTLRLATHEGLNNPESRQHLLLALKQFIRMYSPHEAREDTVLFPALRKIVTPSEYEAMGEVFEREEHRRFGDEGFEKMVDRVAGIEKELGIYDLQMFTALGDEVTRG